MRSTVWKKPGTDSRIAYKKAGIAISLGKAGKAHPRADNQVRIFCLKMPAHDEYYLPQLLKTVSLQSENQRLEDLSRSLMRTGTIHSK
ncbi:MAG: hypothetical protein HZA79_04275 [Sphingobacteriales bacterium]|nr:hypothetical protein [Sphingobacteriales bacterium]